MKIIDIYFEDGKIQRVDNLPVDYSYCILELDSEAPLHPVHAIKLITQVVYGDGIGIEKCNDIKAILNRIHPSQLGKG